MLVSEQRGREIGFDIILYMRDNCNEASINGTLAHQLEAPLSQCYVTFENSKRLMKKNQICLLQTLTNTI